MSCTSQIARVDHQTIKHLQSDTIMNTSSANKCFLVNESNTTNGNERFDELLVRVLYASYLVVGLCLLQGLLVFLASRLQFSFLGYLVIVLTIASLFGRYWKIWLVLAGLFAMTKSWTLYSKIVLEMYYNGGIKLGRRVHCNVPTPIQKSDVASDNDNWELVDKSDVLLSTDSVSMKGDVLGTESIPSQENLDTIIRETEISSDISSSSTRSHSFDEMEDEYSRDSSTTNEDHSTDGSQIVPSTNTRTAPNSVLYRNCDKNSDLCSVTFPLEALTIDRFVDVVTVPTKPTTCTDPHFEIDSTKGLTGNITNGYSTSIVLKEVHKHAPAWIAKHNPCSSPETTQTMDSEDDDTTSITSSNSSLKRSNSDVSLLRKYYNASNKRPKLANDNDSAGDKDETEPVSAANTQVEVKKVMGPNENSRNSNVSLPCNKRPKVAPSNDSTNRKEEIESMGVATTLIDEVNKGVLESNEVDRKSDEGTTLTKNENNQLNCFKSKLHSYTKRFKSFLHEDTTRFKARLEICKSVKSTMKPTDGLMDIDTNRSFMDISNHEVIVIDDQDDDVYESKSYSSEVIDVDAIGKKKKTVEVICIDDDDDDDDDDETPVTAMSSDLVSLNEMIHDHMVKSE